MGRASPCLWACQSDGSDGIGVLASCPCSPAAVFQEAQVSGGIAVLDMSETTGREGIL